MHRDEGVYHIKLVNNEIQVRQNTEEETQTPCVNNTPLVFTECSSGMRIQSECYHEFNEFFTEFSNQIRHNCSTQKQADAVFNLCEIFAQKQMNLCKMLLQEKFTDGDLKKIQIVINATSFHVSKKLQDHQTQYKRLKLLRKNPFYLEPETKVIGLKWKTKTGVDQRIPDHTLVQSTFEYVPILKSLKMLFSNQKFHDQYFNYNQQMKHKCEPNFYQDICCGEMFAKNGLYQRNPHAIQIEISVDDFEVCSPLKSKTTIHKVCGVYFRVRNMPLEFNSRLNSIHLVALCLTENMKASDCSFDDVAKHIISDIHELEDNGIEISPGNRIKGTLVHTSHDNLGGNQILGFVESFIAENCCRICECDRSIDFQTLFREDSNKLRRKSSYENQASLSERSDTVIKGIKHYCILNDLKYFHMLDNTAVDLMHDMNEGVIPFFVQFLFTHMIENNIAKLDEVEAMVRDFKYGKNNRDIKPSRIKLKKRSCGQSASQIFCIMKFLPFILFDYKNQLVEEWEMMNCLLEIIQIVYSCKVGEDELKRLEHLIENHLWHLVQRGLSLKYKHHMITHYPNVIRRLGPVIHGWMMRYEAKHKTFTTQAHNTNNFINITKSLAYQHQEFAAKTISFENKIEPAKKKTKLNEHPNWNSYSDILYDRDVNSLCVIEFLQYNNFTYRRGQLFLKNGQLHRIKLILQDKSDFLFVCEIYLFEKSDVSAHSFKIKEDTVFQCMLLNINELNIKNIVDEVVLGRELNIYFIAETLDKINA